MTRVLEVSIHGLAGRSEPLELKLQPTLNIFYGPNGSGKTSLLRILHSAIVNDGSLLRRVPFLDATVTFLGDDTGTVVRREISAERIARTPLPAPQVIQTFSGPVAVPGFGPTPTWDSSDSGAQYQASYLSIFRLFGDPGQQFWVGGPEGSPYSEGRLEQQFFQLVMNRWANYSNQLLARIREMQDAGIAEVLGSMFSPNRGAPPTNVEPAEAYEEVRHFLSRRHMTLEIGKRTFLDRYGKERNLQRAVAAIQDTERQIAQAEQPRHQLEELIGKFVSNNKHITFRDGGIQVEVGSAQIGIDLLSSGEKHLLRILVECLAAQAGCVLVDEPELSLHIDWQRELAQAMQIVNPSAQVIMATHSPDVMADVPDSSIFAL